MRPVLASLLLAAAATAGEPRAVSDIVADHAAALGNAGAVRTLAAVSRAQAGRARAAGIRSYWRLPAECVRIYPTDAQGIRRQEWFTGGRFFLHQGHFVRFRGNQATTRGGYYVQRALAEPFPLLPYVGNDAAQRGLKSHELKGFDVLTAPRDEHGVRPVYLIDAATHLLHSVRFEEKDNRYFAQLTFHDYRAVDGVMLPHGIVRAAYMLQPNDQTAKLDPVKVEVAEVLEWKLDADLAEISFDPPGFSAEPLPAGLSTRSFATGPEPVDLAGGDLDGDGKLDVAVACDGGVWVHFGGSEREPVVVRCGPSAHRGMAIADLDRDGRNELVTTSNVAPDSTYFLVDFDAARKPRQRRIYGAPRFLKALAVTDLDRDGLPDLVGTGVGSRDLRIKFGNGVGGVRLVGLTWRLADTAKPHRLGLGFDIARIDADALPDIVVADGERVAIFQGQMNLAFLPKAHLEAGPRPVAVACADLDGDGDQDFLVANDRPPVDLPRDLFVVLNGDGQLKISHLYKAGSGVRSVVTGHFNADAHVDAAVPSFLTGELRILAGDGRGEFAEPEKIPTGRGPSRLALFDHDGDGRADLGVANQLEDTVTIVTVRREVPVALPAPERLATATPPARQVKFALEGLSDPYEFAGAFRVPIREPSGIAVLGGDPVHTQLVVVSDEFPVLYRVALDRVAGRMLVGPSIGLRGLERERLDLEGVAYDSWTGNLFLACESDSSVLRVSAFGHVLGRVPTGIAMSDGNDGLEAVAVRRAPDGTPLLYAFRERMGKTLGQPPARAFTLREDPFALEPRGEPFRLPERVIDQTGACVVGQTLFVVTRFGREVLELAFRGDELVAPARRASFRKLTDGALGLASRFGNVEGIAVGPQGDLFLAVDNNHEPAGPEKSRDGRILWFRNRAGPKRVVRPDRIVVQQIHIPWQGAQGNPETELTRAEAEKIARDVVREARSGADFERLADRHHYVRSPLPRSFGVVDRSARVVPGDRKLSDLPVAMRRLLSSLEVGDAGIVEFHSVEAPFGYHVFLRIE